MSDDPAVESRDPPPPVVYVDHAAALGGAEMSLLELLRRLDRDRYRPVLACVEGAVAAAARQLDLAVHVLPLGRLRASAAAPAHMYGGVAALAALLRDERAALVHANTLRAAAYASMAGYRAGTPHVWHVRDIHVHSAAAWWLCRRSSAVIANSRAAASALPCAARARVIYNPVAVAPSPEISRSVLGLPEGALVASVGILRPWKGHSTFIEVAAQVRADDARFLVIGGRIHGDEERDVSAGLEAQARALGIADRVCLLGHRDDMPAIWPHLSVLVHAARAEPFGRVVAEALLSGVPVVAFREGGVPEIVDDGESGVLVAPRDVPAMAAAVDRLLASPDLRAAMGAVGRERAGRRFSPEGHARAVEALYDELLERPSPAC